MEPNTQTVESGKVDEQQTAQSTAQTTEQSTAQATVDIKGASPEPPRRYFDMRQDWIDPTEQWEPPGHSPLSIEAKEIAAWTDALLTHRIVVLRGLDTTVLFAAEQAVAGASPFNEEGFARRSVCRTPEAQQAPASAAPSPSHKPSADRDKTAKKPSARQGDGNSGNKDRQEERSASGGIFPSLTELCDPRLGTGPMLVTAAAYGHSGAWRLIESLPFNMRDFDQFTRDLKELNRCILILATPSQIELTPERRELALFKHVADFLYPRLTAEARNRPELPARLQEHYLQGLWTQEVREAALDEEFYEQFSSDLKTGKIIKLVEAGEEVKQPEGSKVDPKTLFAEKAAVIRQFPRPAGWPTENQTLEQTILFVAGYLAGLTAADFDRVVRLLLGADTKPTAVAVRGRSAGNPATTIHEFRDVALSEIWLAQRNELLAKSGLRALIRKGKPTVSGDGGDAFLIRQAFRAKYPFTYAELWRRALAGGLLFDASNETAEKWIEALVDCIVDDEDTKGFGKTFLLDLLLCDSALGPFEGDFGERFDELAATGQHIVVIARIGELLSAALLRGRPEPVLRALDQLMRLRAWSVALRLIDRLSTNTAFPLADRLKLVRRILNQGGKEYWDDACALLERWCGDPREGWPALVAIKDWLPTGAGSQSGPMVAAAGVLIDLAGRWFTAPETTPHPLVDLVATAERDGANSAEVLGTLVKWLFQPCFELACHQRELLGFFGYWLLAGRAETATVADRARLADVQQAALRILKAELAQIPPAPGGTPLTEEMAAVRECQAVILADWADALIRAENGEALYELLLGALSEYAPGDVGRQVRAVLQSLYRTGSWIRRAVADHAWEAPIFRETEGMLDRGRQVMHDLRERWKPSANRATHQ
jgi:hypothetical protein